MIELTINGLPAQVEEGTTLLEAARFLGFPIPTLCYDDGLKPYGACRLCVVEVGEPGRSRLVSACTSRAEPGMIVHTRSARVEKARRLLVELYVATSPQSKRLQDLASAMGVREVRYPAAHESCIQCGLCVRTCEQQMMAGAIGFAYRGARRRVSRPFDMTSELCRQCGACLYVCPVSELRCQGADAESTLCSGCLNFSPVCMQSYDDAMCFLDPCCACEISGPLRADVRVKLRPQETATPGGAKS
jgi:NADH dehydrogenase/NADH:ubiquinone oxidoreductase subunit G